MKLGIFAPPLSRVKVGLIHQIENSTDTMVSVVLASSCEIDTKAVRTHWLIGLHMLKPNVLASTVQHGAAILK